MQSLSLYKHTLGYGAFTVSDIAWLLNIDKARVSRHLRRYWDGLKEELDASASWMISGKRLVNFKVLVEFKVVDALLNAGYTINFIMKTRHQLQIDFETPYPYAHYKFFHDGKSIYAKKNNALVIRADGKRQQEIPEFITTFCEELDFDEEGVATRYWPAGKDICIVVDPHHQYGMPTICNTNIKAELLYEMFLAGDSKDMLADLYQLKPVVVEQVISFYEQNRQAA